MGKPLTSRRKIDLFGPRRSRQAGAITLQSLLRLADLDLDELLDRVRRGHVAPVFTRPEALGLMLMLRRERSRRVFDWDHDCDPDDENEH